MRYTYRLCIVPVRVDGGAGGTPFEEPMAERTRNRRNTLERRCLSKSFKRMFAGSPKGIFKMLEKVKRVK